jgi:predicted dinucleotide-binding enzyme
MMGSRKAGNEKAVEWQLSNGERASQGTFADAASFGELVFNCTMGIGSLDALAAAGKEHLNGKILIDVSNPLDFSKGMPPVLTVCNQDSLGEQIQRHFPDVYVVKALNTMWCGLMVNPRMLSDEHNVFICGNFPEAKSKVKELLSTFGWKDSEMIDLGDISSARGTEMYLPLWLRAWGAMQTGAFNIKLVR